MKLVNNVDLNNPIKTTLFSPVQEDGKRYPIYFQGSSGGGSSDVYGVSITIPTTGWKAFNGVYNFYIDIENSDIKADMLSMLLFEGVDLLTAQDLGLGDNTPLDGKLRIYTMKIPTSEINANLKLFGNSSSAPISSLPIATRTRAGVVKIADENISIADDGAISIPALADTDNNGVPDIIDKFVPVGDDTDETVSSDDINSVFVD